MSCEYVANSDKGRTKEGRRITTSEVVLELNSPHLKLDVLSSDIHPSFLLRFQILESKTSPLQITHINIHSSK